MDDSSGQLPRKIERMNAGTGRPKNMGKASGGNLPFGGSPSEQDKAYMGGKPKNKGSMLGKTGDRPAKPSAVPGSDKKPLVGTKPFVKSKKQPMPMKKGKK